MLKGPKRKPPAPRSSRLANTLGASKRGTHSQSTEPSGAMRAPVWQSDRKAYSAIGVKGDVIAMVTSLVAATPPATARGWSA